MIKQELYDEVQSLEGLCQQICRDIWANPEEGGSERSSADLMRKTLEEEGFAIINEPRLETAFCAEYGTGHPVIAILGEYDALPGLSQKSCAVKEAIVPGGPGHGCGHNLLGAASITAAIAVKRYLEKAQIPGTVRFYGCPEEELLCGKVKMAYYHMFDGCDAAISWHPGSDNTAHNKAYLANTSARFYFKGLTAHAAMAPHQGRSALDAVELMSVGANYLREHVIDRTRIHYTTDSGGFAPNIVPDKASAWYFVRAPHMSDVRSTMERLEKVAKGAAMMTETEVEIVPGVGCCELEENISYADLAYANLVEADQPKYTPEEMAFAEELRSTVAPHILEREKNSHDGATTPILQGVSPRDMWEKVMLTASSDSGDVSKIMPTCLFTTACWPLGVTAHTWQATAASGSTIGEKGALYAAKISAGIAYDLYNNEAVLGKITKEFRDRKTEEYVPMYTE